MTRDLQLCERAVERLERTAKYAGEVSLAAAGAVCRELLAQMTHHMDAHDEPGQVAATGIASLVR